MEYYDLDEFSNSLADVRDYLAELAFLDGRYGAVTSRWVAGLEKTDQIIAIVQDLPLKISGIQRMAAACDRDFSFNLKTFLEKSDLQRRLSRIATKVRIANSRKSFPSQSTVFLTAFLTLLNLSGKKRFFQEENINIEELISDTDLFRSNVITLSELLYRKRVIDDEIFQPSNVNSEEITRLLDEAIESLQVGVSIPDGVRKRLLEYLDETKSEISKSSPSWKKVVGALLIASAISSGLADAPQAAANIRQALDHIMGHSIPASDELPYSFPFKLSPPVLLPSNRKTFVATDGTGGDDE